MNNGNRAFVPGGLVAGVLLTVLFASLPLRGQDSSYKIDSALRDSLAHSAAATAPFFVVFGDRADLKPAQRINDRAARGKYVVQSLIGVANRSQAQVTSLLRERGVEFTPFWVENKVYLRHGTLALARELARRPEVVAILPDEVFQIPQPPVAEAAEAPTFAVEWNIAKIGADQVWPITRGQGIVVANTDTGVQYNHPALVNQFRGTTGPGTYSFAGNWLDITGECGSTPCDNNGHGTHVMGTEVGSDGGANQIGVAPGAQWIACKALRRDGVAMISDLISCAQWFLDPYGTHDGRGRPDVVNNSWGGSRGSDFYEPYLQSWRAAGIFPAFAIGNNGSNCGTAGAPGDNPDAFAAGATDIDDVIAYFSSRGPSLLGGILKPEVTAPGVAIRSSWLGDTYHTISGTSMASPHVAGAVALIWAAAPAYRGKIDATEWVLQETAVKLYSTQTCGGVPGTDSPNNTYGWGRIDAEAAVAEAMTRPPVEPTVSIMSPANGASYQCPATVNFAGSASDPKDGNLSASIAWSDNGASFGAGGTTSRYYTCNQNGNHEIVTSVTDSIGATDIDRITIAILPGIPDAPTDLTASKAGFYNVVLNWRDNSHDETGFYVERAAPGEAWGTIAVVGSNATAWPNHEPRGMWSYRVLAFNQTGVSPPSNVISVEVF